MPLPPKRERIYQARRDARVQRLIGNEGWPPGWAEAGIAAWEAYADGEGRDRDQVT